VHGLELLAWFVQTEAFKKMQGKSGGKTSIDSDLATQSFENESEQEDGFRPDRNLILPRSN